MDKEMRRKEKAIAKEEVIEILNSAEYGVLCTISADNTPYGTPMNLSMWRRHLFSLCSGRPSARKH